MNLCLGILPTYTYIIEDNFPQMQCHEEKTLNRDKFFFLNIDTRRHVVQIVQTRW